MNGPISCRSMHSVPGSKELKFPTIPTRSNQIHHIFNTLLPLFQDATGMLVNVTKTEGLQLGSLRRTEVPKDIPAGIEWCREGSYIISLGAPIGNGFDVRAFWLTKYYKCKSILSNWWSLYRYTVYGKAMLANSMIYSRFRYWAQTLHMPDDIAQAIDSDVQAMVWGKDFDFNPEELGTTIHNNKWINTKSQYYPKRRVD